MAYYLIDFENVKKIVGLEGLNEADTVAFFYSEKANALSFELHQKIGTSNAKFEYIAIESGGKNALDFQLSTYLGYLLARAPSDRFYIISKDQGFANVVSFWKDRGCDRIVLQANVDPNKEDDEAKVKKEAKAASDDERAVIVAVLKKEQQKLSIKDSECGEIANFVLQYKTKQAINNAMMKLFRNSDKVGEITKVIKPFLKGKK